MSFVDVSFGLDAETAERLADGAYRRDGGVIRDKTSGQVVAILRDGDAFRSPLWTEVAENLVPLVFHGVSMYGLERRLGRVEAELQQLLAGQRRTVVEARLVALHEQAAGLGTVRGKLRACHLDLRAGRDQLLPSYRKEFLETFYAFRELVLGLARDRELFRFHPQLLRVCEQAMILCGVAARDLTERIDDAEAAAAVERQLLAASTELCATIQQRMRAPSALFWLDREHLEAGRHVAESHRRLSGQVEIRGLLAEVVDPAKMLPTDE